MNTRGTHIVRFPDRHTLRQFALTIQGCRFPYPGLYTVQLFCDNTPVCDTTVRLLEPEE